MVISAQRLTRARLYFLLDAVEEDLRAILQAWIVPAIGEAAALDPYYDKAVAYREREATADSTARLVDYLDLGDEIALINRNSEHVPAETALEFRRLTREFEELVPIRNRVMHGRPLLPNDTDDVARIAATIATSQLPMVALRGALSHLAADPYWQPTLPARERTADRVINNLPWPDFDETGIIGRGPEIRELTRLLANPRNQVITVVGEGGIGKTSLAVKVLYDLIDDPHCPFDAVLWTSLKTEILMTEGPVAVADAIRDVVGAARALASPLGPSFSGNLEELGELLKGMRALIVIDNTETVSAEDVLRFYDAMPAETRFLFTSRVGIGQLERRMPLRPLAEDGATKLFRLYARRRNVAHLASLNNELVLSMVRRLRLNPLAIKWFINAVENGGQPELLLSDQARVLEYCVRSIFDSLSASAHVVLTALFAVDRSASFTEPAVVGALDQDSLTAALHELQQRSLVEVSAGTLGITQSFDLTPAVREFMRKLAPPSGDELSALRQREEQVRVGEELRRKEEESRRLSPSVVAIRYEADIPLAHLLRQALSANPSGDYDRARHLIEQARGLSPDYFEVYRVHAFVEATAGNPDTASALYHEALSRAAESRPLVAHFFAGHLVRGARRPHEAVEWAEYAHGELQLPDTAAQLGQAYMATGRLDDAERVLADAQPTATGRTLIWFVLRLRGSRRIYPNCLH